MYSFVIFCLAFKNIVQVNSKLWVPQYENENTFDEPYDYVDETHLPNFLQFGKDYEWNGVSGTSLINQNNSFIAFAGTQRNTKTDYSSVYRKQAGIIVLCSSTPNSSNLGFNFKCTTLEEHNLNSSEAKYFGAAVRSAKSNDKVALIYCDPLWFNPLTPSDSQKNTSKIHHPTGKCKLKIFKDFEKMDEYEYKICDLFQECLGGFSVDLISIDQDLNIIFGLPFANSTLLLNRAESNKIGQVIPRKSDFFNFGYSVAFSGDGAQYASSPVSDSYSSFVEMLDGDKFYPLDVKTQRYGGFGMSIDTVRVGNFLYGVVIGAPYQSKENIPNVGAIYLACKGHKTNMIFGKNAYDYFGYSVARLGDINFDGSEEFVVSSPSLDFDKPGKIYIYGTFKDCSISKFPLQIYQSEIKGFGVSISRGFDINFNGMPDFFVTALDYQKPLLFKMPNQEKVSCQWVDPRKESIFTKNQIFEIKVIFNSYKVKDFSNYFYQVSIDFLNKDKSRFKLIERKLDNNAYIIKLKALLDVQDMNLKIIPLKVAIRGIRSCKVDNSKKCYESKVAHITWSGCEKKIQLSQSTCSKKVCSSDLNIDVKPDSKGHIIYFGEQKNYQRTIEITINNNGPDSTSWIYLSIDSKADLRITNVDCSGLCKNELTSTEQNAKIIIKDSVPKREDNHDDFKIIVNLLYIKLENVSSSTSINFNILGVNDDNYVSNNNFTMSYSVSFKPNLSLLPNKTGFIIDPRIRPPYLEKGKRISIKELGTELKYSYLIENKGPELKNVEFKFYFPYKTEKNEPILYIMDDISTDDLKQRTMPSISNKSDVVEYCQFKNVIVNPLSLIGIETHKSYSKTESPTRIRRAISKETKYFKNVESSPSKNLGVGFQNPRETFIECNKSSKGIGTPICGEIICKLHTIPSNSEFTFDFRTWLFTKTFFDYHISDLSVIASLQSDLGNIPKELNVVDVKTFDPIYSSKSVIFKNMKITEDKPLPLWPIIVAVIIGIFLLVIIIIIAYYCGFFKRKRLRKERQKLREKAYNDNNDNIPLNAT